MKNAPKIQYGGHLPTPTTGDFLYVIIDTYDGILSYIQSYKICVIQNYMDFEDYYI